jgi:hypothetical protein
MKFGKWKGHLLEDIPTSYLTWVLWEIGHDLGGHLRRAMEAELEERGHPRRYDSAEDSTRPASGSGNSLVAVGAVVDRWHRELTLKHHPDRGGSHEVMVALNHAHDRLKVMLWESLAL